MSMTTRREPRERPGRLANRNHTTTSITNHTMAINPCPLTTAPPYEPTRATQSGAVGAPGIAPRASRTQLVSAAIRSQGTTAPDWPPAFKADAWTAGDPRRAGKRGGSSRPAGDDDSIPRGFCPRLVPTSGTHERSIGPKPMPPAGFEPAISCVKVRREPRLAVTACDEPRCGSA